MALRPGRTTVKKVLILDEPRKKLQFELPFDDREEGLEPLERKLREMCDPLGLKVILGCLHQCHQNRESGWFYYEPNQMLDLLGYTRRKDGFHQTVNKRRVESRLITFMRTHYLCEWQRGDEIIRIRGPLLFRQPSATAEYIKGDIVIAKGERLWFEPVLYDDIKQRKMYSWADERFLSLDADKRGKTIQLYTYY